MKARYTLTPLVISVVAYFLCWAVCAGNATAQTKNPPVKSIKRMPLKPVKAKTLPDLVVEHVGLDSDCELIITLKNVGPGAIPASQFRKCVVRIRYGKNHEDFNLGTASKKGKAPVDANGALLKPGGKVSYNTKIRVHEPFRVGVYLDYRNEIAEVDDKNNRSDIVTLTPNCPKMAQSLSKTSTQTSSSAARKRDGKVVKPMDRKPQTVTHLKAPSAVGMAVMPRISRAFDLTRCRKTLIVLKGQNLGNDSDGRQVRLVRSNTAGDPVMTFFLTVRTWSDDEIIADMPDQLCYPPERVQPLSEWAGRFTVGLYRASDTRWLSNEAPIETGTDQNADSDRDGHAAARFGCADCDDNDSKRFPGNLELADFEGHDEDCDPATIGVRDEDDDGFTDSRVWNDPAQFRSFFLDPNLMYGNDCDAAAQTFTPDRSRCAMDGTTIVTAVSTKV